MRRRRLTYVRLICYGEDRKEWTWSGYFWNTPSRDELVAALEVSQQNAPPNTPLHQNPPWEYLIQVVKLWDGKPGDVNVYFAGYRRLGTIKTSTSDTYIYEHESNVPPQ